MKVSQLPDAVLMVRPASFGFNEQTAETNAFQTLDESEEDIRQKAIEEFDRMVDLLKSNDIEVHVFEDTPEPVKPDSLFPNNWISFHSSGDVILYPMLAENRRHEVRVDFIDDLKQEFEISAIVDLRNDISNNQFLEGTGSIVFDYVNRMAYACRSPRTNEALFKKVCEKLQVEPILFDAIDENGAQIYHTNVMMCVGEKFAVVCLDSIMNENDQEILLGKFAETGHQVVAISYAQMKAFAGNMIEIKSRAGEPFVILSEQAFNTLLPGQIDAISRHAEMIPVSIPTIEKNGGGSVRCMIAGIFLPRK